MRLHDIQFSVYKAIIPEENYTNIYALSKTFQYEGRGKAAVRVFAGTFVLLVTLPFILTPEHRAFLESDSLAGAMLYRTMNYAKAIKSSFTRFGYSCKKAISPSWIEGTVHQDGSIETVNPNYIPLSPTTRATTLYVLDGNNPQKIWQEGIHYVGLNTPGNIIFFFNINDAFLCAEVREDSLYYDPNGGWRRYHPWTNHERIKILEGKIVKKTIMENSSLEKNAVNIISGYLGFFTKKEKAKKISHAPCESSLPRRPIF